MSRLKILTFIFFISISYFISSQIYAQQNSPDQKLLDDIKIMEVILDKIITPERGHVQFFGSNTRGYYLMNYGIIFNVSYSLFHRGMITIDLDRQLKSNERNYVIVEAEKEQDSTEFDEEIEKLKKSIGRFLSEWTTALISLNSEEKVTVIVDFNSYLPTLQNFYDFSAKQLIASISIKDIMNYRQRGISQKEFFNRIIFDEVKSIDEDISILSNVIQTSLEHTDKKAKLGMTGDVKGLYFKGYGAVFFTDVSFGFGANNYSRAFTIYSDALKKGKDHSIKVETFTNNLERTEKDIEKIEQKLIELISNYGASLRTLQPDEWLEIAINFKGITVKDNYSKSILKVQKKIIDEFSKDKLKFDQFKKQVNIIYY